MYLKIADTLLNMDKVQYVNKRYEEEGKYTIHIGFPEGAYVDNHFETKEEADALFDDIMQCLTVRVIS